MSKKVIIALVVIVVILGAGTYFGVIKKFSLIKKASAPDVHTVTSGSQEGQGLEKQTDVVITYTDEGFTPNVVNVKKGGTVVFKNESSRPMLIASAPHPTHTDYPELNAKNVANKGETYSFTFEKVGSWGFHNHLSPNDTGTVEVN